MLRNRKHEEATKLKGVDLIDDESDLDLGSFTTLENWIPADVYAIKKKRGTSPLSPNALLSITTEGGDFLTTEAGDHLITEI